MIEHIKKESLSTSVWAGGTTTEILIQPFDGDYKNRLFNYRISTATVELETSTFTELPGIKRAILSLDHPLQLIHNKSHVQDLKPYEVAYFDGGWETISKGQVTDFNVMTNKGYESQLEIITLSDVSVEVEIKDTMMVYTKDAPLTCVIESTTYELAGGDMLFIKDEFDQNIILQGVENQKAVLIKVKKV